MPAPAAVVRKLANLVERIKARNAGPHDMTKEADATEEPVLTDLRPDTGSLTQTPKASLLEYVSGKWLDADSIADTNSTITGAKVEAISPRQSSSIHAVGDPSYQQRPEYNDAVQYIYSLPNSRSGSSLYYLEDGRPKSPKGRTILHDQGHRYCCGHGQAQPVEGNAFPITETVHPDWRVHALGRNQAGYWSMEDFSEQHLAARLFYNATIRSPHEHLDRSQKAAAQDLEAMHMQNYALRAAVSEATANADRLEERVRTLRNTVERVDEGIEEMRSCLGKQRTQSDSRDAK